MQSYFTLIGAIALIVLKVRYVTLGLLLASFYFGKAIWAVFT